MAEFANRVYINRTSQAGGGGISCDGMYHFHTTSYSGNYVHFKTNLTLNTYVMSRVEAVGINYSTSAPIRCAWVWYTYTYLTSVGVENIYSGMSANNVYMSTDGYVCFSGTASSLGDTSFILNTVHPCPTGYGYPLEITAVSQNSTAGNYY